MALWPEPQGCRDLDGDELRIRDGREIHEPDAVREAIQRALGHLDGEPRLPRTAHAGQRDEAVLGDQATDRGQLVRAIDQPGAALGQVVAHMGGDERWVLTKDPLLELAEGRARLEAHLVEEPSRLVVGGKGVHRPPQARARKHQLLPDPLAVGELLHPALELRQRLLVATQRTERLRPTLDELRPQLVQARDLGLGVVVVLQLEVRRAAPQRQGLPAGVHDLLPRPGA